MRRDRAARRPARTRARYNLAAAALGMCPPAGTGSRALENIPVVSLARAARPLLGLRQARSSRAIRWSKPWADLLAAYAIWRFGRDVPGARACALLWTLVALTFIDFDTQLLPDNLTLPLLWAGLIANLFGVFVPLADAVIGAIAGYLALWMRVLGVQAHPRQGRHGLRRLQAARGARSVAGLADAAADRPAVRRSWARASACADRVRSASAATAMPFGPYLAIAGRHRAVLSGLALVRLWLLYPRDGFARIIGLTGRHRQRQVERCCELFAARGAMCVDADEVAHAVSAAGRTGAMRAASTPSAREFVRAPTARSTGRGCARARSTTRRFAQRLEGILHPADRRQHRGGRSHCWHGALRHARSRRCCSSAATCATRRRACLVVDCSRRARRCGARSGCAAALDADEVRAIMATQLARVRAPRAGRRRHRQRRPGRAIERPGAIGSHRRYRELVATASAARQPRKSCIGPPRH